MKLSIFFGALIPVVYGATVASRTQGNVFMCIDTQFAGACAHSHGASGQCVPVPAGFNDNISSFGPDSGQDCFIFANGDCTGAQVGPIRSPGIPDLRTVGFNDVMSAFKCFFG